MQFLWYLQIYDRHKMELITAEFANRFMKILILYERFKCSFLFIDSSFKNP